MTHDTAPQDSATDDTQRRYRSVFAPDLFADQLAVVTGGGSGIGRCIAHELASLGARVVITGRKIEKLERVAAEITEDGGTVATAAFDIRDEEAVEREVTAIVEAHGPVAHLVNNAGGQFPAPAEVINKKGFETVVRTNLTGGFLMAKTCYLKAMHKSGGSVVNIIADMWNGMPGMAHSGAARAGMLNLTRTLAYEWAARGVRVNAVAPGWVASSGLDTYEGPAKAMIGQLAGAVPLRRLATEAEVSAAVCFLLSPAAAFITGECVKVDGAASLASHVWPIPDHDRAPIFQGFHRAVTPKVLQGGEG